MPLRSVACLIAWVMVACATPREPANPVAPAAAPSNVGPQPVAPIEPEAAPQTAGPPRVGSEPGVSPVDLEPAEPEPLSELGSAAYSGDEQTLDALLAGGADLRQPERDGATALTLALENYHDEPKCCEHAEQRRLARMTQRAQRKLRIARRLIEHGAEVTRSGRLDLTPLHHAVMAYGPELEVIAIMELLIARGSDVNRRAQPYGRSPLEWAIGKSPERVACLLRHGADPSIVTHEGKTLLQLAEARGDARIVEQLRVALAERTRK